MSIDSCTACKAKRDERNIPRRQRIKKAQLKKRFVQLGLPEFSKKATMDTVHLLKVDYRKQTVPAPEDSETIQAESMTICTRL